MEQLVKLHKATPNNWEYTVFLFANSTMALIGKNKEKCDM